MILKKLIKDPDWQLLLKKNFAAQYFKELQKFLAEEYKSQTIYPPVDEIFSAFNLTPLKKVKVLILGQDPYHGPNQAHGLAFSVKSPCKPPPSLKNIFKELNISTHDGDLTSWAEQGVFMLNTVLTVRAGKANSHKNQGWESFTDSVIQTLSEQNEKIIFVLWGAPAQKKKSLINTAKHCILESSHPSPLSAYRGFLGCDHFNEINKILLSEGQAAIDWQIIEDNSQPLLF